ncbi:MAG: hypothetical protein KDM81_10275 [Verrucomicrobiae bacterium]|nr:hypothetical protein [Verrucomicrobiae bacterium]
MTKQATALSIEQGPAHLPATGTNPPPPDGQCIPGPRGLLAVALRQESLARLRQTVRPTHWLLPVDDTAMAVEAASLGGEVLWLCGRKPAEALGQLHEQLAGAWIEPDGIRINLDGRAVQKPLPHGAPNLPALAEIVAREWAVDAGSPAHSIPFASQPNGSLLAAAA